MQELFSVWTEINPQIIMKRPIYLGLSILKISKLEMYEFWYDYVKPRFSKKAKLCY